MNKNYTYIIASLPVLDISYTPEGGSCKPVLEWIESQLDTADAEKMKFVMRGFDPESISKEYYEQAVKSDSRFIREFFTADLHLRNAKVRYLNRAFERPADRDVVEVEGSGECADREKVEAVFEAGGILLLEKGMDSYLWNKADEITLFDCFTLDNVLAVTAKLCIVERWMALDAEKGREMMQKVVKEVRGSFGEIDYEIFK